MEELQSRSIEIDGDHLLYRDWLPSPTKGAELENWAEEIVAIQGKIFSEQLSQIKEKTPQKKKSRLFKTVLFVACGIAITGMTMGIPAAFGVLALGVINSVGDQIEVWQRGKANEKKSLIQQVIDALKERGPLPQPEPRQKYWVD